MLGFGIDPQEKEAMWEEGAEQAAVWVREYYDTLQSERCVPLGHTVNPNVAVVSGFSLHRDSEEAVRRGLDGFRFFGYSLGHVAIFGQHPPGRTDVRADADDGGGPRADVEGMLGRPPPLKPPGISSAGQAQPGCRAAW
jgi:hypothetical protein